MRSLVLLLPPLLFAIPFAACGTTSASVGTLDGGFDGLAPLEAATGPDSFDFDSPTLGDAGLTTACTLGNDADPVGLCIQKQALLELHEKAFLSGQGAAASWNSQTLTPDLNEAGAVPYTLDNTVAYAAAAVDYLESAEMYGDTTIDSDMLGDIQDVALLLEDLPSLPATEYSGELYFHLRTVAIGLRLGGQNSDGTKIDLIADTYGRNILTNHYYSLGFRGVSAPAVTGAGGDAGGSDAGQGDAGHGANDGSADAGHPQGDATLDAPTDGSATDSSPRDAPPPHDAAGSKDGGSVASGDAGLVADGIIGNKTGNEVLYSPADVGMAAYALLDMANRYPTDPSVGAWLAAVRASLGHVEARAIEPTTGMLYPSLVARDDVSGVDSDLLSPSTTPGYPSNAVLADTQATFALAMVQAEYLVTSSTTVTLTGQEGGGPVFDAGISGPLISVLDLPLEKWGTNVMRAMNGTRAGSDASTPGSLWDSTGTSGGYMDAFFPTTKTLVTTKSTRPNAFMAAAIAVAIVNVDPVLYQQRNTLVQLLIHQSAVMVAPNSNLITVLPGQLAFLRGATRVFQPLEGGPNPISYTTAAVTAAVEGLNDQLFPQSP